jgi:hypothetical protein
VLHFLQLVYKLYSNLPEIGMPRLVEQSRQTGPGCNASAEQARECCSLADSMPTVWQRRHVHGVVPLCHAVSHTFTAQPPASDETNPAPLVHCQQSFKVQWLLDLAETRA